MFTVAAAQVGVSIGPDDLKSNGLDVNLSTGFNLALYSSLDSLDFRSPTVRRFGPLSTLSSSIC